MASEGERCSEALYVEGRARFTSHQGQSFEETYHNTTRKTGICDQFFVTKWTIYDKNRVILVENTHFVENIWLRIQCFVQFVEWKLKQQYMSCGAGLRHMGRRE